MDAHPARSLFRERSAPQSVKVTPVELFFDLVFVFAITQLSHSLVAHFTPLGVLEVAMLILSVWWVWIYTSWVTNWLDPDRVRMRLLLFAMMFGGLVMAAALPKAFESTGLVFALAHAGLQVGRSLFTMLCFRGVRPAQHRNMMRIVVWLSAAGAFWIAGGLASGGTRLALWAIALAIEYVAPWVYFAVPGLGRSATADWDVDGHHMAERCGLFVIIALGESILVTGATFAKLAWTPALVAAFVSAFIGSVAMWWIYFNIGAERAAHHIAHAADTGSVARLAYTYFHLPIVAGIIFTAAADEFVLAHPGGHAEPKMMVAIFGGNILFLAGNLLFKRATAGWYPLSHLVGLGLCALAVPLALSLTPLAAHAIGAAILLTVAVWETVSLAPKKA